MPEPKKPSTFLAFNMYAKNVCSRCSGPSTGVLVNNNGKQYLCLIHIKAFEKARDALLEAQEKRQWGHADWYRELVLGEDIHQLELI